MVSTGAKADPEALVAVFGAEDAQLKRMAKTEMDQELRGRYLREMPPVKSVVLSNLPSGCGADSIRQERARPVRVSARKMRTGRPRSDVR
jgi:hypothetical protein